MNLFFYSCLLQAFLELNESLKNKEQYFDSSHRSDLCPFDSSHTHTLHPNSFYFLVPCSVFAGSVNIHGGERLKEVMAVQEFTLCISPCISSLW